MRRRARHTSGAEHDGIPPGQRGRDGQPAAAVPEERDAEGREAAGRAAGLCCQVGDRPNKTVYTPTRFKSCIYFSHLLGSVTLSNRIRELEQRKCSAEESTQTVPETKEDSRKEDEVL